MIPFNVPPCAGNEIEYLQKVIDSRKICGDGPFTKQCAHWLETKFHTPKAVLTTSGTTALEMAALLCDLTPQDEVILPSFTFSSTANAFVLTGAKLVFVDVRPDTMNIDETKIEAAITSNTKVIVPVHYAGVACEMDAILKLAQKYHLKIVEDAAQGVMSKYKGQYLGTLGDFGCFSFHETKNFSMGEGGALLIRDAEHFEKAEILWEKGTDRSRFFRGQVDKYTWVGYGSSYLPSELNVAYLMAQLDKAESITQDRLSSWHAYYEAFLTLQKTNGIQCPTVPENCEQNAHMFYLKCRDLTQRTALIHWLKEHDILATFHYVPLHSAPAGLKFGRFFGKDVYTTQESEKLVRLPLYYNLSLDDRNAVIQCVLQFFNQYPAD